MRWLSTGDDPLTVDEARAELVATLGALDAQTQAIRALTDDVVNQADAAMLAMHVRADRDAEYNLLCGIAQRLRDVSMIVAERLQR
jgi:hypothetical protein